jgi:hypothetical protein
MSIYEPAHEFQAEMEEHLPELANITKELKFIGARVFDTTAYTDELLREDDMSPPERAKVVAKLLAESTEEIFRQSEDSAEHSANWEMTHPLWSDKVTYGYLYHEKTPDWELFDIACAPVVLDEPDNDTMLTMQIEIDSEEINVFVEGDQLDFTQDSETTDGQYAVISHVIASIKELDINETTAESLY